LFFGAKKQRKIQFLDLKEVKMFENNEQDRDENPEETIHYGWFSTENPHSVRNSIVAAALLVVVVIVALALLLWPFLASVGKKSAVALKPTATQTLIQVANSTQVLNSADTVTPAPVNDGSTAVVITATGVSDLGQLLNTQQMTPVVSGNIAWDNMKEIADWREDKGLTGAEVLYAQSGVPNQIDLPMLKGDTSFTVPQGTVLIFGALSANVTLGSGNSFTYDNGFYGAIGENTDVKFLTVNNGFLLLVKNPDAQAEYCARIAQAANQKWAMAHLYRPAAWGKDPVCAGTITTVIDPND